jgi:hypothetical protein
MAMGARAGVGFGAGAPATGGPPSPNPNLLLWSEELDRAATWVVTDALVVANSGLDDDGAATADLLLLSGLGSVQQVTAIAGTAGSGAGQKIATSTRTTHSVSASIDGVTYVFSARLQDPADSGLGVQMGIFVVGGFIACRFRDLGDESAVLVSWAKLETPTLTAYIKREGT